MEERIRRFLLARHIPGINDIEITVNGRTAILSGVIRDAESYRRCVECCRHVVGVAGVVSNLRSEDSTTRLVNVSTNPRPESE